MKKLILATLSILLLSSFLPGQNRVTTWGVNDVLTSAALNGEFNNIYSGSIIRTGGYWGANDDIPLYLGTSSDTQIEWDTGQTNDAMVIGLGGSNSLILTDKTDIATDYTISSQTNPSLIIHSADETTLADYLLLSHDQTDAVLNAGAGGFSIQSAGTEITDITSAGDWVFKGTTPTLTIGDAGAEDAGIVIDGNVQDFYIAVDDSADKLTIGLGATIGTTPLLTADASSDWVFSGVTPVITIGDAGAEDTAVVFDGNVQDYYIALDDSADTFLIGLGNAVGTTPHFSLNTSADIGIGTASPLSKLHVIDAGTSGTPTINAASVGVFQRSSAAGSGSYISIVSGNAGLGRVNFGDTDSEIQGIIEYNHSTADLIFYTAASAVVTIDSAGLEVTSGKVLIGNNAQLAFKDAGGTARSTVNVDTGDNVQLGSSNLDDIQLMVGTLGEAVRVKETTGYVGIGTSSPGKKLELYGTASSATAGPHARFLSDADAYPLMEYLNYTHDNVQIAFDAYWDSAAQIKSSDAGSNFRIAKNGDVLRIDYESGIAAGSNVTWSPGIDMTSAGLVGIGIASPDGKLHVWSASAGIASPAAGADELTLENSGDGGMTILTPAANSGAIYFGDPDNNNAGGFVYDHSANSLTVYTATAVALTVDSAGELGIGEASPDEDLHITNTADHAEIKIEATAADDGAIIEGRGNSSTGVAVLSLEGYDNTNQLAGIYLQEDASNPNQGEISFFIDRSVYGYVEVMRIDYTGAVVVSGGTLYADAGMDADQILVGAATGGFQGSGSVNAESYYTNGTPSDYVFNPGYEMHSIDEMAEFIANNRHLPTIKKGTEWGNSINLSELSMNLWETVEVQALYIVELNERIKKLEASR